MKISVIIPCVNEKVDITGLLDDIRGQKVSFDVEEIRIDNKPSPSKARNKGCKKASGEVLVFIDSDIRLGSNKFLQNLVSTLIDYKDVGMACASIRIPEDSNSFQRRYSEELAHSETPVVNKIIDVFVASSACCVISRQFFNEIGGFNEDMVRGEDSEISHRILLKKYRVVMAPETWCYHPQPAGVLGLIKLNFRNGLGVSYIDSYCPELNIDVHPEGVMYFSEKKGFFSRLIRFIKGVFESIFKLRSLLLLSKASYITGYICGIVIYKACRMKK